MLLHLEFICVKQGMSEPAQRGSDAVVVVVEQEEETNINLGLSRKYFSKVHIRCYSCRFKMLLVKFQPEF